MIRLIAFLLYGYLMTSNASTPVNGSFDAIKSCPAYLSKNNKTNPDKLTTQPSVRYSLVEINRNINPRWLRIVFEGNPNPKRWVSVDCGQAEYQLAQGACNQNPGMADSYVLALSWQPGFCQTYGYEAAKPECFKLSQNSYAASHVVLHGLWPNQDSCGHDYGYCGVEPLANHCDYPSLNLSSEVSGRLHRLMPSFAYGSCLERHEWNKHGSCQILTEDAYFSLALRLTEEADASDLGRYLHKHVGERIKLKQLEQVVEQAFGKNSFTKVYLGCKNGILVDILIQLPPLIPHEESLLSLVKKAPSLSGSQGCPLTIKISDFSRDLRY